MPRIKKKHVPVIIAASSLAAILLTAFFSAAFIGNPSQPPTRSPTFAPITPRTRGPTKTPTRAPTTYVHFTELSELKQAVSDYCDISENGSRATAEAKYGPINMWEVSVITTMDSLFVGNEDCSTDSDREPWLWRVNENDGTILTNFNNTRAFAFDAPPTYCFTACCRKYIDVGFAPCQSTK